MPTTAAAVRVSPRHLPYTCLAVALAVAWVPATAKADAILSATAQYTLDGGSVTVVPNPSSPPADIFPSASETSDNSIFGHVYSYANGINGSRSSGVNTYTITGTSDYTNTFTNTGSAPADFVFNYDIAAGQLGVSIASSAAGTQSANLSAIITVNGSPAFNYESSMSLASASATPVFSESDAVLNPAGPTLTTGMGSYTWGDLLGSVSLGLLDPGQQVTVDYQLISTAIGEMTNDGSCGSGPLASAIGTEGAAATGTEGAAGTGSGPCNNFAIARIGDPFNGDGTPTTPPASFGFSAVPEPASMLLLGAGLAGLAFSRRRTPRPRAS